MPRLNATQRLFAELTGDEGLLTPNGNSALEALCAASVRGKVPVSRSQLAELLHTSEAAVFRMLRDIRLVVRRKNYRLRTVATEGYVLEQA